MNKRHQRLQLMDAGWSEWFKANVGTRQGDSISPRAFVTFLERLMDGTKELPEKGITAHGQREPEVC